MTYRMDDFLRLPYSLIVVPEQTTEGLLCYVASHSELPGCMSHGDSTEEAIANLREAKELYIKTLLEKGQDIPPPKSLPTAIWEVLGLETEYCISTESIDSVSTEVNPIESLESSKEEITII